MTQAIALEVARLGLNLVIIALLARIMHKVGRKDR